MLLLHINNYYFFLSYFQKGRVQEFKEKLRAYLDALMNMQEEVRTLCI